MDILIYEYEDESDRTDYLDDIDDSFLYYECASDGNIYVSADGLYSQTKKIDDLINELFSAKEGIENLRKKYGANRFLELDEKNKWRIEKGIFDVECGALYDIPIYDFRKKEKAKR